MRRLLVPNLGKDATLTGEQYHRAMRVLRMKPGDRLRVFDGQGREFEAVIEGISREQALLRLEQPVEPLPEPRVRITLLQSIPRGDGMERVVQKAAEVGVAEVVPLMTRRTVPRPGGESAKLTRWRKIALHAIEQSGRARLMPVEQPIPSAGMAARLAAADVALVPHYGAAQSLRRFLGAIERPQTVCIVIGPEGGFDSAEVEQLVSAGAAPVSLGRRVLRAETAGVIAAALVLYHFGDMD